MHTACRMQYPHDRSTESVQSHNTPQRVVSFVSCVICVIFEIEFPDFKSLYIKYIKIYFIYSEAFLQSPKLILTQMTHDTRDTFSLTLTFHQFCPTLPLILPSRHYNGKENAPKTAVFAEFEPWGSPKICRVRRNVVSLQCEIKKGGSPPDHLRPHPRAPLQGERGVK